MTLHKLLMGCLLVLLLTACQKSKLDLKPISSITSQNMWKTQSDAQAGVTGMYARFRTVFNQEDFLVWFEFRSGFWKVGASGASQYDDLFFNTPNSSSTLALNYSGIYQIVNAANLAIKYIPDIEFSSDTEKNRLLAEAYFMRGYCYFALARLWGDVPLIVSPIESLDDPNLFSPRAAVSQVFVQIKADIGQAAGFVPDNDVRDRVRASAGAIQMLKADVYLWTASRLNGGIADFETANNAADAVLTNSGYSLLASYEQVFRVEQNQETIFSIYFNAIEGPQNQYGQRFTYQPNQVVAAYRNNPVPVGTSAQWHTFNDHFINDYLNRTPGDIRVPVINQNFTAGNNKYRWVNKYLGEIVNGTRLGISDTRIYRFAEAILFKAEALNGMNDQPGAIAELNKIAKRAYGIADFYPMSLSKEKVNEMILIERLIELAAEGKSWFDLIRMGKAFEWIPSLVGREGDNQGNILLFPLSPATITKNPSLQQTPGF